MTKLVLLVREAGTENDRGGPPWRSAVPSTVARGVTQPRRHALGALKHEKGVVAIAQDLSPYLSIIIP